MHVFDSLVLSYDRPISNLKKFKQNGNLARCQYFEDLERFKILSSLRVIDTLGLMLK
jgi:hypothetical protein